MLHNRRLAALMALACALGCNTPANVGLDAAGGDAFAADTGMVVDTGSTNDSGRLGDAGACFVLLIPSCGYECGFRRPQSLHSQVRAFLSNSLPTRALFDRTKTS